MKIKILLKIIKERVSLLFDRDKEKLKNKIYRDWLVVLMVSVFLIVLFAGSGYFLFLKMSNEENFTLEEDIELREETFDQAELSRVLEYYDEKATDYNTLFNKFPSFIDPR